MYLGVDLGTSSIKVIVADDNGCIIDSESINYPISFPQENFSEQNPNDWIKGFKKIICNLGKRLDLTKLLTISFSGQMHGLVILDKNDEVIRPCILWNDGRTVAECAYLNNVIGKDNLIEWTGNIALTGFTAPKLLWLKNNEAENFNRISKIMLPKDYLQYIITGVYASDVSDNSGTLYFDVANKKWSEPMLNILGINEKMLPEVFESSDIVGNVSNEMAKELGLSTSTVVVIGGGDQAMGAIGTGTINDGQISISLGTSGVIFINANEYVKNENASLHSFAHANGKYHLMGVTLSCAASSKWWVEDVLESNDYVNKLMGISKMDVDNLIFLPYLIGERSPINDPFAKGCLYGLSVTSNQKSITKSVIEGICFSLKDCLEIAKTSGISAQFARVIGGGSQSDDWLQILSDILNIEIRTINTNEGGALGAIILGMYAVGKFSSISEACDFMIKEEKSFYPKMSNVELYQKKFLKYKELYRKLKL